MRHSNFLHRVYLKPVGINSKEIHRFCEWAETGQMNKSKATHKGKNNPNCNQKMTCVIWELKSQKKILVV